MVFTSYILVSLQYHKVPSSSSFWSHHCPMLKQVYIVFTHLPLFLDMFPKSQARLEEKNYIIKSKPTGLQTKYTLKCLFYYTYLCLYISITINIFKGHFSKWVFRKLHLHTPNFYTFIPIYIFTEGFFS